MMERFENRNDAGKLLAEKLTSYRGRKDVLVLGLPRGGVPVAYEVATKLDLPLDILLFRKLGVPGQEEFAFGAIASGGTCFINDELVHTLQMPDSLVAQVIEREKRELERREKLYRGNRPAPDVRGKTVIIADDGLATGSTMMSAVMAIKHLYAKEIVVAVPVCAPDTCRELRRNVNTFCTCVYAPEHFYAVGLWYKDFHAVTDDEVSSLLEKAGSGAIYATACSESRL